MKTTASKQKFKVYFSNVLQGRKCTRHFGLIRNTELHRALSVLGLLDKLACKPLTAFNRSYCHFRHHEVAPVPEVVNDMKVGLNV